MNINDIQTSPLFCEKAFIGGEWVAGETGNNIPVNDPASGTVIANVADCSVTDVQHAIEIADKIWDDWKAHSASERSKILRRWYELILENTDTLAAIMSLEQGKPLKEAAGEVAYGASFIEWFAEEAKRIDGTIIPGHQRDKRIMVLRQPVGVVAAITPWNFPIAMITRKCGPALAAGCPVVVKPASATPLSALALAKLAEAAGVPPGVLSVVPSSNSRGVGEVLTKSPLVRKVSFTGSTQVGRILLEQSASTIKKVSMELGGNAPVIVFDDADIDQAVAGTIAAKYRNTGQTCVCANRVLVQSKVYDEFVSKLAKATSELAVGAALEGQFDQGPLIDENALAKVEELVEDAKLKGGKIVAGGARHALGGTFYQPTVVAHATADMNIAKEEVFGPVAPVFRFDTEEEAIEMANDTEFGLASYFFAKDLDRVFRVMERIEAGMVGVNTGLISTEVAPFGGIKESGLGREGSKYGIEDFTELKYVCIQTN